MKIDRMDQQLWDRLRKGQEKALSELFMLYADDLYNYGYMLCRNKELVEDCLQDVFFHLWLKRENLTRVRKVRTYLMVALHNRIKDVFRKTYSIESLLRAKGLEELTAESSFEDNWIESDRQAIQNKFIRQALDSLPERMQQAVFLRYFRGFGYKDIAEIMNIRPQVAANMVHRATQKLRAYSKSFSEWLFFFSVLGFLL